MRLLLADLCFESSWSPHGMILQTPLCVDALCTIWQVRFGPFGWASHNMPLNFSNERNNAVQILEWEAQCDQNTAAILVIESPYIIKHNDFV